MRLLVFPFLLAVTLSFTSAAWTVSAAESPVSPALDEAARGSDPGYAAVLAAYRGALTEAEVEELAEQDPAPALYLSPANPGERAATRFFASLPEEAHAQLQKTGYLKWRVDRLPKEQRGWLKVAVQTLEGRREGPFPLNGKVPVYTGFGRVQVEGLDKPQYCWWIHTEDARPAWVTLVRALGLLTQEYSVAYREQLPEIVERPETEPIPSGRWLKVRETPRKPDPTPPAPALIDEKYYWSLVRAYRGQAGKDELRGMTEQDPLLGNRLRSNDPAGRAVNELFARLTEAQHRTLMTTGRLVWAEGDLNKSQRRLVDTVLRDLNARTGGGMDLYLLAPAFSTRTGFALVRVPEAPHPVISWWVRSSSVPHPSWVPLANDQAVKASGYYRAHLEQLPGN